MCLMNAGIQLTMTKMLRGEDVKPFRLQRGQRIHPSSQAPGGRLLRRMLSKAQDFTRSHPQLLSKRVDTHAVFFSRNLPM